MQLTAPRILSRQLRGLLFGLSALAMGRCYAQAPLATISSASLQPGASATLSISVTSGVTNVMGFNLYLQATAPADAPALSPSFSHGTAPITNWLTVYDPANPWHFAVVPIGTLSGPAEMMKLTVQVSQSATPGTVYHISPTSAVIADDHGTETDITSRMAGGTVTVLPNVYGDLDNNGEVDVGDVTQMLRIALRIHSPTFAELLSGDVRPKPGIEGRSFGDGRIGMSDVNWMLRRSLGFEKDP
jgi:hypothetical protein